MDFINLWGVYRQAKPILLFKKNIVEGNLHYMRSLRRGTGTDAYIIHSNTHPLWSL